MEYRFEEAQKLRFAVYDLDNETASLADDDFLGSLECSLGEVYVAIITYNNVCTKLNADPIIPIPSFQCYMLKQFGCLDILGICHCKFGIIPLFTL